MRYSKLLLAGVLSAMMVSVAVANNQNPNLNWGCTDFMDAAIPGSGLILNPKVSVYSGSFKDANGKDLPGDNTLDVVAFVPQVIYIGKQELPYGLKWGAQALWPIVGLDVNSDLGLKAGSGVLGDPCVGPLIGSAIPLGTNWVFHWFAEFDTYFPVGSYDKTAAINNGANFWSFEPYLTMTLQMPYGLEFSTRQHYTFNGKNSEYVNPSITGDYKTHDLEAGDLWHFNWALSKSLEVISPMLRVGVVGYYGQQLGEDRVDGTSLRNSKEQIFGVGPGVQYIHKGVVFNVKAYWETGAENRTEGTRVVFRTIIPF